MDDVKLSYRPPRLKFQCQLEVTGREGRGEGGSSAGFQNGDCVV